MKIVIIGDPHGSKKVKNIPLKGVDLILIPGDLGRADLMREMAFENVRRKKEGLDEKAYTSKQEQRAYMQAYNSTMDLIKHFKKFAPVYVIFGNVESSNAETKKLSKKIKIDLPLLTDELNSLDNVKVINDKVVNFNGVRIGGLNYFVDDNWVRDFDQENKKKLNKSIKKTARAKKILEKFGYVDILLCHQPPYGILDRVNFKGAPKHWQGKRAGSKVILNYIKKYKPDHVFCGHIHEGRGEKKVGQSVVHNVGVAGDYVVLESEALVNS